MSGFTDTIGSVQRKMHLTSPAYLAAVAYIFMAIVVFSVPFDTYGEVTSDSYHKLSNRVMFVISLVIPMILSVFSINCMASESGKWCTSWSWVQALLVAVWVAVFIWMVVAHAKVYATSNVKHQTSPSMGLTR